MSLLTFIIFVPLLAAIGILFIPRDLRFGIRLVALASTLFTLLLGLILFLQFDGAAAVEGYKFYQRTPWVAALGIHYEVGVDGINLGLVLMAVIVAFAAACVSHEIQSREKEYYFLLLLMTGGIIGAFSSLDLFFFYFFHELALVPTFIMIGVWGRGLDKNYATFKITLYLSIGALLALVGLIGVYLQAGAESFSILDLQAAVGEVPISVASQHFLFPFLMFGFGILVSLWPFHTWAPLGYSAAPTATAMLHAGVLKKFGLYGLIRIALPLMPEGAQGWVGVLAWLCLGNILYVGWVAMRQRDLNYLIANSSVAHMGFVFLGIASLSLIGVTGAVFLMIAHGLLAALLFGLSGFLYHQTRSLDMAQMGGLLQRMPFLGAAFVMAMLAGCGVPGFANFAGEVMVLFGAWESLTGIVSWAVWGALVIGGVYMIRAIRNIWHGPMEEHWNQLVDANAWRRVPFVLLLAALLVFGFFPGLLTNKIEASTRILLSLDRPEAMESLARTDHPDPTLVPLNTNETVRE